MDPTLPEAYAYGMLDGVDPLLQRIEALPKRGSYAVTLVLADGQERIVVVAPGADGRPALPAANLPDGWSPRSDSAVAVLATIDAFHDARTVAGAGRSRLVDIDGGWDVSIGNVVLGPDGQPACVTHGPLEPTGDTWTCAECGAAAMFATD
jgi:hypothetical protein